MIATIMVFIVSSNLFFNITGGCCPGYSRAGPPVRICWLGDCYFRLSSPSSQPIQRLCHIWCGSPVSAELPHQGLCKFHGQPRIEHHHARVLQPVVSGWYIFQQKAIVLKHLYGTHTKLLWLLGQFNNQNNVTVVFKQVNNPIMLFVFNLGYQTITRAISNNLLFTCFWTILVQSDMIDSQVLVCLCILF